MPQLPNPSLTQRSTPSPSGPAGALRGTLINSPGADTAISDALGDIGDEAHKFMLREKARMDDVAVDDAKNQYLTQALELENEYTQVRGGNAANNDKFVSDYTTKLDAISKSISPTFKNDSQRRAWDKYYGTAKVRFTAGVMQHQLTESDRYASDTYAGRISTSTQVAHSNPYDYKTPGELKTGAKPGVVNTSAGDIVESVTKEGLRLGWNKDILEVNLRAALSPFWSGIAAKYINNENYDEAEDILEQHQDVIGSEIYDKYQKAITQKKEYSQIKEDVGLLFAANPSPSNNDISEFFNKKYKGRDDLIKQAIITAKSERTAIEQDRAVLVKDENNRLAGAMLTGKLDYDMIGGAALDNKDKLAWKEKYDSKRMAGSKYESDVITRAELRRKANTDPENLSDDEIWNMVYAKKGITDAEAQEIQNKRDVKLKALKDIPGEKSKTTSLKRAHGVYDEAFKAMATGTTEEANEKAILKANAHEDLDDYMAANPDANPIDYVEQQLKVPEVEQNSIISAIVRKFKGTTPEGKAAAEEFVRGKDDPLRAYAAEQLKKKKFPVNRNSVDTFLKNNKKYLVPFDPEGDGYDYQTAIAGGVKPDKTGHWPSRNPKTGQILKGKGHKTFNKTIKGEIDVGNEIFKGEDGKYYSFPKGSRGKKSFGVEGEW